MLIIVVTRSRDQPWTIKFEYVKHAHSKRKKHTQSKTNRKSTIKGSISKREDHADSTQIGRTLYSGMKRESSQSHTSGTVHSNTHLTIKAVVRAEVRVSPWSRWWSMWKSWCLSGCGGGQVGSQSVWNQWDANSLQISKTDKETIWYVIMYITNLVDRQGDWSNKLTLCETPSGLPTCLVVLQRRCFKHILYYQILKIIL